MPRVIYLRTFKRAIAFARNGRLGELVRRALMSPQARVKATWNTITPVGHSLHWNALPAIVARWNTIVAGDPQMTHYERFARTYLAPARDLVMLSVGCGAGAVELEWAKTGVFRRIDAYDFAERRIAHARATAQHTPYEAILNYQVADVYQTPLPPAGYDVVLAEGALHHFAPVSTIIDKLVAALKPNGYFIANEYVGPNRFQWTDRQLAIVNRLLATLPRRYRIRPDGTLKERVQRPSLLGFYLIDPSEAVESAQILPALQRQPLTLLELHKVGGTILNVLLSDIAHNFAGQDRETRAWLNLCMAVEDRLIAAGDLPSDFVVAIWQKPAM